MDQETYRSVNRMRRGVELATGAEVWIDDATYDPERHFDGDLATYAEAAHVANVIADTAAEIAARAE